MHVLMVFFITVYSGQGCSSGCAGVAMQEFSSHATCNKARVVVDDQRRGMRALCVAK